MVLGLGTRLASCRLREPIMLKDVGWRTEIDAARDGVTLVLRPSGEIWVYKGGQHRTILHPGIILQSDPYVEPQDVEV
jgi:hypothetical protein